MTKNVMVTANVDKHKLIASEVGLAFAKTPAWSRLTRTLTVRDNYGTGSWTAASNQSWLTVTPSGVSGGALTLTADTTGLTADQIYSASVTLTSSSGASPETVSVGLWNGSITPAARTTIAASYTKLVADPVRPLAYVHGGSATIDIYNIYTAASVGSIPVSGTLSNMAMSPDGKRLYIVTGTNTIAEIDPVAKTIVGTWSAPSVNAYSELLYVRPNGDGMLVAGGKVFATNGSAISATAGIAAGGFAVSPAQDTLVAMSLGLSPATVYVYGIDYSAVSPSLSVVAKATGYAGGNGKAIAVSRDGSSVITAGGGAYEFGRQSLPGLGVMSALTGAAYPNNVRVGSDGRIFAAISDWYGTTDFWVYRADGSLQSTYLLRGYAREILDNELTPSGDALMAVALTAVPNLQFVAVGP
ncbi:MAG TPA: hypothetical protein VLC92_17780 [Rhodocyclaceae bacterium]|nr:hypothetical protein [Rhodocyclaceae bacterium]